MTVVLDRRRVLAGGAAAALAGAAPGPLVAQAKPVTLTFAFARDETGAVRDLVDAFNAAHKGEIRVTWREAPARTDAFFDDLRRQFAAGTPEVDVFGADVIWTAEMAAQGWIADLSGRIHDELAIGDFLKASVDSARYRNRLFAVPWFTSVGMLFYRRDLLEAAGFADPPGTWDQLARMARAVMDQRGVPHGFVFQGDAYEGGVTNALEFIWSAGGRAWRPQTQTAGSFGMNVTRPTVIGLNSAASRRGLAKARELVAQGVAPAAVTGYHERDAIAAFGKGEAVFMRNWPFAYGRLGESAFGALDPAQIGVAPIPTLSPAGESFGCLGGWNLAIAADSPKQDAAWRFVRFAVEAAQQRALAATGGFLPTLRPLYDDAELQRVLPILAKGRHAIATARARPRSPIYSRLSPPLARMFNGVLTGETEPGPALRRTQAELEAIVARHR